MLCAVASAATIVTIATYFSAAVSTTHSIIGAVIGFGLVFGGADAIVWNEKIPDFPYRRGKHTPTLPAAVPVMCSGQQRVHRNPLEPHAARVDINVGLCVCIGVVTIFLSWFISPIMAGGFGAIIFLLNKYIILRRKDSFTWAFWSMPVLVLITVWINLFFVLLKVRLQYPCEQGMLTH